MDEKDQELRDFFAAMALCGMLAHRTVKEPNYTFAEYGEWAYKFADAMMESR